MHREWCGKPCGECTNPCRLDEELYCSPDCPCLGKDGEMNNPECKECDAYKAWQEDNQQACYKVIYEKTLAGTYEIEASSSDEAEAKFVQMMLNDEVDFSTMKTTESHIYVT